MSGATADAITIILVEVAQVPRSNDEIAPRKRAFVFRDTTTLVGGAATSEFEKSVMTKGILGFTSWIPSWYPNYDDAPETGSHRGTTALTVK